MVKIDILTLLLLLLFLLFFVLKFFLRVMNDSYAWNDTHKKHVSAISDSQLL
jgi:uncharacterized protein HemY